MRNVAITALALLGLLALARPAHALDIKNVRSTYGPYGGIRPDSKLLPGDLLWLAFDIEDLTMHADSGLVKYNINLEVMDSSNKVIFKRPTSQQRYLSLGKGRVAERAQVILGAEQPAGKYSVKVTVTDFGSKDGQPAGSKSFTKSFELLKPDFGLIHCHWPSVVSTIQGYEGFCSLTGMARDAKKMPNVEVRMRILDESGKPTLPKPFTVSIPKDTPAEAVEELKKDLFPLPFPILWNRPGRFTVEVEATDLISKKSAKVSFPIQVLETSAVGGN
jgi:hypothetical protein